MVNQILKFHFERSTKGAHRYFEVDPQGNQIDMADATVGTLYLRKASVGNSAPQIIKVEISGIAVDA